MKRLLVYVGGPRDGQQDEFDDPIPTLVPIPGDSEGHYEYNAMSGRLEWKGEMWRCEGGPLDGEFRPGSGIAAKGLTERGHIYFRYARKEGQRIEKVWRHQGEASSQ
jgi:hypothetical protein